MEIKRLATSFANVNIGTLHKNNKIIIFNLKISKVGNKITPFRDILYPRT